MEQYLKCLMMLVDMSFNASKGERYMLDASYCAYNYKQFLAYRGIGNVINIERSNEYFHKAVYYAEKLKIILVHVVQE
jgi:hypothetical protein